MFADPPPCTIQRVEGLGLVLAASFELVMALAGLLIVMQMIELVRRWRAVRLQALMDRAHGR